MFWDRMIFEYSTQDLPRKDNRIFETMSSANQCLIFFLLRVSFPPVCDTLNLSKIEGSLASLSSEMLSLP